MNCTGNDKYGNVVQNILHQCPKCKSYHSSNEIRNMTEQAFDFINGDMFFDPHNLFSWICPSCHVELTTTDIFIKTFGVYANL